MSMSLTMREYVYRISAAECAKMTRDYAEFERTGVLGDCTLREYVEDYSRNEADIPATFFIMAVEAFIKEVWRRFALPVLEGV